MRGTDGRTNQLFSYVSCEARVTADRPLRSIRMIVDEAPEVLSLSSRPCMRRQVGRRLHRRSCCEPGCYKRFVRFARSGS